jgi:hypothetical protein
LVGRHTDQQDEQRGTSCNSKRDCRAGIRRCFGQEYCYEDQGKRDRRC